MIVSEQDQAKFWSKVDKDTDHPKGCWEWRRTKPTANNYGGFHFTGGNNELAHRVSWLIHYGEIPDKLWVLHKCDNHRCVNPEHLFLGTPLDNTRDKELKGRGNHPKGEKCVSAKLTVVKVREIRRRYMPYSETNNAVSLAQEYNVSQSTIRAIANYKTWKQV